MTWRCTQNLFHYSFDFQIHTFTEQLKLEGTFDDHLVQGPCQEQEYLLLDQVVLSPIQTEHEHFQCGESTTTLGDLLHCLTTFTVN